MTMPWYVVEDVNFLRALPQTVIMDSLLGYPRAPLQGTNDISSKYRTLSCTKSTLSAPKPP